MRKIIIFIVMFMSINFALAEDVSKPLETTITFDWISKNQMQRDENIKAIQSKLFNEETVINYDKKMFRSNYADFLKNKNYLTDYDEVSQGKKDDDDKYYCGFFYKNLLIAYGIQYKKNMNRIYYYDAMGTLKWTDTFSSAYPNFPYWSYQYDRSGKMVGAFYYLSDYDQYIFTPDKKFKGRWYKDKMYNRNAKIIMTRSNYGQE